MTDPIADMLTRIRNALSAEHEMLQLPASKIKVKIAEILKEEGFINEYSIVGVPQQRNKSKSFQYLQLNLRYDQSSNPVVRGLQRVSKPSRRQYVASDNIPRVRNGLGIAILTTSKGVMTDKKARTEGVGGEVLCYVW